MQGFVLGGRNVGSWLTAFAFGTSYFSAVIFVGYAGQFGWKYGLAATWIGIGNALIGSLLAWRILGRRTRLMTQHLQSATMPDFFGKRFFSDALKVAASVIVFVFLIPYTASLYNGLSRLFSMAFNVDYVWCVLGMAILTGIYVLVGGYMATAVNDFIQGLIMLVGICAVIGSVLAGNGGFTGAVQSLSQIPSEAAPGLNGTFVSFLGGEGSHSALQQCFHLFAVLVQGTAAHILFISRERNDDHILETLALAVLHCLHLLQLIFTQSEVLCAGLSEYILHIDDELASEVT